MDVAVWGAVTGVWWMSSTTVLLPFLLLLKYNKYCRESWFSFFYVLIDKIAGAHQSRPLRKKAFELLKDNLTQRDVSKPLKVLEIGVGPGSNFEFYPENCHVTALDINTHFDAYLRESQHLYPNIKYEKTVICVAENMKDIEDASFDVVVCTYVLCYVTSVKDALKEVKRVLKPGGKFLFLEHIHYPKSEWGSFLLQKITEPLWNIYMGGCSLVRNSEIPIRNAGFSEVKCYKSTSKEMNPYVRPQIYGIATK